MRPCTDVEINRSNSQGTNSLSCALKIFAIVSLQKEEPTLKSERTSEKALEGPTLTEIEREIFLYLRRRSSAQSTKNHAKRAITALLQRPISRAKISKGQRPNRVGEMLVKLRKTRERGRSRKRRGRRSPWLTTRFDSKGHARKSKLAKPVNSQ